jgi:hypothetical protein
MDTESRVACVVIKTKITLGKSTETRRTSISQREVLDEAAVKETKRPTLHGRVSSEVAPLMLQQKESGVGVKICCACVDCRVLANEKGSGVRLMQERGRARVSTLPFFRVLRRRDCPGQMYRE